MSISVTYLTAAEVASLAPRTPLCVVGFGAPRPDSLPDGCPFVRLQMRSLVEAAYEVWTIAEPVVYSVSGPFAVARGGDVLLALAQADETPHRPLEQVAEQVYDGLLDMVDGAGYQLIRLWNYLPDITGRDKIGKPEGMERYRRFNVGRHEAFVSRRGPIRTPPAASALGSSGRPTVISALAAVRSGMAIENPRQVSAYNYPSQYGPRSPTFSRATLSKIDAGEALFISGTASIVGHSSVHLDDVAGQIKETIVNLRAVLAEAGKHGYKPDFPASRLKVYLRREEDLPAVRGVLEASFPDVTGTVYLKAEICRTELLVEIEAMCPALGEKDAARASG